MGNKNIIFLSSKNVYNKSLLEKFLSTTKYGKSKKNIRLRQDFPKKIYSIKKKFICLLIKFKKVNY